jgi:hypothetical protein
MDAFGITISAEGSYDETERVIQRLLGESARTTDNKLVKVTPRGLAVAADYGTLRSPESYLGYEKAEAFASDALQDAPRAYTVPRLALNQWGLAGNWTVKGRAAALNEPNGKVVYRFHARDVNLIMGPPPGSHPVRFTVKVDGKPPGVAHGTDVDDRTGRQLVRGRTNSCPFLQKRIEIDSWNVLVRVQVVAWLPVARDELLRVAVEFLGDPVGID